MKPKQRFFAIGLLLAAMTFAAGSMFSACGSRAINEPGQGTAGTSGQAGTSAAGTVAAGTGPAGTTGAAGSNDAAAGAADAYPAMIDGRCVSGAFTRDGVCKCQPDTPLVCGAACTNPDTDNDNCGGCDNKCGATSTCIAGSCGPAPAMVVPPAAGCLTAVNGLGTLGLSLAIAGSTLYVADAGHGTVASVPLSGGGTPNVLAKGEMAPHSIAAAGTTAVWIDSVAGPMGPGGRTVVTATLRGGMGGGASVTLVTAMNEAGGIQGVTLSVDGSTVYYSSGTSIYSIPATGGTPTNVGNEEHSGEPGALALDGVKLAYPKNLTSGVDVITLEVGKVARCGARDPQTGELDPAMQVNCQIVARGGAPVLLTSILARANRVYFVMADSEVFAGDTGPGATFGYEGIASSPAGAIGALAMSADRIYFVHDDVIERTPIVKDSTPQPIARHQKGPASLAVGATKVYWGNDGDCSVASTDL